MCSVLASDHSVHIWFFLQLAAILWMSFRQAAFGRFKQETFFCDIKSYLR